MIEGFWAPYYNYLKDYVNSNPLNRQFNTVKEMELEQAKFELCSRTIIMFNEVMYQQSVFGYSSGESIVNYPSGHSNKAVSDIIFILDDWAHALEDGTVGNRRSDVNYTRASGKPDWTEEELDVFVRNLDWEFDQEVLRAPGLGVKAVRGPGFVRLAHEQRLALAQELDAYLASVEEAELPPDTRYEHMIESGYFKDGKYVSPTHVEGYEPDRSYLDD